MNQRCAGLQRAQETGSCNSRSTSSKCRKRPGIDLPTVLSDIAPRNFSRRSRHCMTQAIHGSANRAPDAPVNSLASSALIAPICCGLSWSASSRPPRSPGPTPRFRQRLRLFGSAGHRINASLGGVALVARSPVNGPSRWDRGRLSGDNKENQEHHVDPRPGNPHEGHACCELIPEHEAAVGHLQPHAIRD